MQTITAPIQILCESAHELYLEVLQSLCFGVEIASVSDPKSVGSAFGKRDRPTKELRYTTLVLENPTNRLVNGPFFLLDDIIPRALLCTLSDASDLATIGFYNPKASDFSDDGKTISSNYGFRCRHPTNQIEEVIRQLKTDPSSRRAVIHIHSTGDAHLRYTPCIDSLHFLIRNEVLECQSFWRSENALTLLPTNIFEFTMLQELIASELEIPAGKYVHTVSSLHYYIEDQHRLEETIEALQSNTLPSPMESMPHHSLRQIDTLRAFEEKLRLKGDAREEFLKLPEYWQKIGQTIAYAIAKRR